ncbi:MAG: hypothetical protein DRI75_12025, partial [Bacteroidetes bacterium]
MLKSPSEKAVIRTIERLEEETIKDESRLEIYLLLIEAQESTVLTMKHRYQKMKIDLQRKKTEISKKEKELLLNIK